MQYFEVEQTSDGERLIPLPASESSWYPDKLRGPAITLALARSLERVAHGRADLRVARISFDLHSPVPRRPVTSTISVLREGRRLMLADAELRVGSSVFARARALLVAEAEGAGGMGASFAPALPPPPSRDLARGHGAGRLHWNGGDEWVTNPCWHGDAQRQAVWLIQDDLVVGERLTALQLVSAAADLANLVTNAGPAGIGHINADTCLSIARLPVGHEMGVVGVSRMEVGGIVAGTAMLFDRRGPLGTSSVTSMPSMGPTITHPE